MEEVIRKDIISVIADAERFLSDMNTAGLKELSNHTIHNSSIFQDQDSIIIAVLIYSLSKIMERSQNEDMIRHVASTFSYARSNLLLGKDEEYRTMIKDLMNYISKKDSEIKHYIAEVLAQARLKKGGRIYEHGISAARTAEILGISQWELMGYIGNSSDSDAYVSGRTKNRIMLARTLFSK